MKKIGILAAMAVAAAVLWSGCATPPDQDKQLKPKVKLDRKEREKLAETRDHPSEAGKPEVIPFIRTEPSDLFLPFGSTNAQFTLTAGPLGLVSYQWYFNDVPIPGATSFTYHVSQVTSNAIGYYHCLVSTEQASKLSAKVTLTAYSIAGNVMTMASLPPAQPVNEPYTGCPYPAIAKLRFPQSPAAFVRVIRGLPADQYWVWDENSGTTRVTYQGYEYFWDWDCGHFGYVDVVPGYSNNYFFMVYFPSTPPPPRPYYILVSGFTN